MATPTTQVLLDDGTDTFPHDITAYVLLVSGYTLGRGREDEQSATTAGSLTLTLKNGDGRFSPGSTTIADPSPVVVDAKIRLKETVNGTTFTRFTGYVKSWPVAWPAVVDTHSAVTITATDAQARAERRTLRSVIEEEIALDDPDSHYTLGEAEGSTSAVDSSGNQRPSLSSSGSGAAVTFGTATGPGTDGLTAATFSGGQTLVPESQLPQPVGYEASFVISAAPASSACLIPALAGIRGLYAAVGVNTAGKLESGDTVTANSYADGETHHLFYDATTFKLYIDGAVVSTGVGDAAYRFNVGHTGTLAHLTTYTANPSAARIAAHSTAMSDGFDGESGTDRITRLAGYAGIPVGTLDTSLTDVAHTDFTGRTAWDAIQEVADAEVGIAFIDGSGDLRFHNRNRNVTKSAPDITVAATYVTPDAQPVADDQRLINYMEATREGGSAQVARDTTSEDTHGRYTDNRTYLVTTDDEALQRANWIVNNYSEPSVRFGTLTLDLYAMSAADAATVLAAEPDTWLRVTGMPSQTPGGTTLDLIVEGFQEERTSTSWRLACNVIDKTPYSAWVLDDATFSVLDSTTKPYI